MSGRHSRPHTGRPRTANTPRGLPTAGGGGGDGAPINLDEELQTVLRKEYDDGESGKMEAIHDIKAVLDQVAQDPMAQQMDKLLPRFLAPPKSAGPATEDLASVRAHTSRSKPCATPRHAKLTARPSTAGGKSGYRVTEERLSVPNIPLEGLDYHDTMRITTSDPTLPDIRYRTASSVSSVPAPTSSASSQRKSRSSKTVESTTTEGKQQHFDHRASQDAESALSTTTPASAAGERDRAKEADRPEAEGEMPFTENLLEITSDTEEAEEIWKSDIVELTRIKSAPKGKSYIGPYSLELKYKDPIWPHQLFLNQILTRHPSLTHLVLDGSELRFLRDLGSSLQSLITLSICECGLRSLDGIYGMPNLRTLIARKNMISIPTQLSFLRKLSYLDLSSNPISSADEFGSLRHCGELRILKLYDTPLAINQANFNKEIKRLVPQLKEIHPSRLYDLIGMPRLMVRSSQITSFKDTAGDHQQNPGQNQKQGESKQVGAAMFGGGERETNKKEKSRRNDPSMMPSLAYNDVMADQPKPGIAYQKIETNKTLKEQEQEHRQKQSEIKDVSLGTGDFSGIFMAPKFLQHLEETMPPSTAEDEDEDDEQEEKQQQQESQQHHHHYPQESFGDAANFQPNEILNQENLGNDRNVPRKKSDRDMLQRQDRQQQQQQHSSKNHPRGDGDPSCY